MVRGLALAPRACVELGAALTSRSRMEPFLGLELGTTTAVMAHEPALAVAGHGCLLAGKLEADRRNAAGILPGTRGE